ncbi:MAG: RlmE family RNA methyltransferase [Thermoplasmatota archaeon]
MSKKWLRERSKDAWYKLAKREGWRSRASYKLLQIDEKFNLIHEGDRVVDLGAAPGGWSQVAVELVGAEGIVVGVDLDKIEPMNGAIFLRGDMTRDSTVAKTLEALGGEPADVVISDMSPNISGSYTTDEARSAFLAETAMRFAEKCLVRDGKFVCKVFEGESFVHVKGEAKKRFQSVRIATPDASRSASSEVYLVGLGFKGPAPYPPPKPEPEWEEGMPLPPSRRPKSDAD